MFAQQHRRQTSSTRTEHGPEGVARTRCLTAPSKTCMHPVTVKTNRGGNINIVPPIRIRTREKPRQDFGNNGTRIGIQDVNMSRVRKSRIYGGMVSALLAHGYIPRRAPRNAYSRHACATHGHTRGTEPRPCSIETKNNDMVRQQDNSNLPACAWKRTFRFSAQQQPEVPTTHETRRPKKICHVRQAARIRANLLKIQIQICFPPVHVKP